MDLGQHVIENVSTVMESFNVSMKPWRVFINKLYANCSRIVPLIIDFNKSDIGALLVDVTTYDGVHGLVYFDYTFIVVDAAA